jgi:hypothetical protein
LLAPIVPINHSTNRVVELRSLRLRNIELDSHWSSIWLFADLLPMESAVSPSWLKGQDAENELALVTVHPTKGKHGWDTICILRLPRFVISRFDRKDWGYCRVAVFTTPMKRSPFHFNSSRAPADAKYEFISDLAKEEHYHLAEDGHYPRPSS